MKERFQEAAMFGLAIFKLTGWLIAMILCGVAISLDLEGGYSSSMLNMLAAIGLAVYALWGIVLF